jgi:drug/metabolite transporter (DMT)-like permease
VRGRQILVYVSLALIWGTSFVLVLRTVEAFGWAGAVAFRALLASAILLLIAVAARRRLSFSGHWRVLAIVGATTVAGQLIGLSYANPLIGTAMTAIFAGTIPLFSAVIGRLWGMEHMMGTALVGLLLGLGGVVLLVGFPVVPMTGDFVVGCVSAMLGALSAAIGSNYAARHLRAMPSWEQSIGAFLVGGLITLPLLALVPIPDPPDPADVLMLVVLAAVCSSLAYVLYFRLVAEVGATLALSVEFGVTVTAVALGALLLGERLSPVQLAGAAVIIVGCAMVIGLVPRRSNQTTPTTVEVPG